MSQRRQTHAEKWAFGLLVPSLALWLWLPGVPAGAGTPASLSAALGNPTECLGRQTTLRGRFAGMGRLYDEFKTPFTPDSHLNFALWPEESRLWEPSARGEAIATLYVPKNGRAAQVALELSMHDLVELTAWVRSDHAGQPWFQVVDLRRDSRLELAWPQDLSGLLAAADASMAAGRVGQAAALYGQALENRIPEPHHALVLQRMAAACQADGRPLEACGWHEKAVHARSGDPMAWAKWAEAALACGQPDVAVKAADQGLWLIRAAAPEVRMLPSGKLAGLVAGMPPRSPGRTAASAWDWSLVRPESQPGAAWSAAEGMALEWMADWLALRAEALGRAGRAREALALCETLGQDVALPLEARARLMVRRARILAASGRAEEAVMAYRQAQDAGTPLAQMPWLAEENALAHACLAKQADSARPVVAIAMNTVD